MRLFTGDGGPMQVRRQAERIKFRYVATATPSPNDYIELLGIVPTENVFGILYKLLTYG